MEILFCLIPLVFVFVVILTLIGIKIKRDSDWNKHNDRINPINDDAWRDEERRNQIIYEALKKK